MEEKAKSLKRIRCIPTKKWTHDEENALIEFMLENPEIETPTAQIYYNRFEQEKGLFIEWKVARSKVRYMRQKFEKVKAKGASGMCKFYYELDQLFGNRKADIDYKLKTSHNDTLPDSATNAEDMDHNTIHRLFNSTKNNINEDYLQSESNDCFANSENTEVDLALECNVVLREQDASIDSQKVKRIRHAPIKRWSAVEETALIDFMISNKDIEKPTARLYYTRFVEEKGFPIEWKVLRSKVRHMRVRYDKANVWKISTDTDNLDEETINETLHKICKYYKYLDIIFGRKTTNLEVCDESSEDYFVNSLNETATTFNCSLPMGQQNDDNAEICRCCINPRGPLASVTTTSKLFTDSEQSFKSILQRVITKTYSLDEENKLPQSVCKKCIDQMITCYKFIVQVENVSKSYLAIPKDNENVQECLEEIPIDIPIESDNNISSSVNTEANQHANDSEMEQLEIELVANAELNINQTHHQADNIELQLEKEKSSKANPAAKKSQEHQCFLCPICGLSLGSRRAYATHVDVHTDKRPFLCNICQKSFKRLGDLRHHKSVHLDYEPYVCTVCGKGFKRRDKLTTHMVIHSDLRPFKCLECSKTFKYNAVLKSHMLTHTGERPHECRTCEMTFSQRTSLNKHCSKYGHEPMKKSVQSL